MNNPRDWSSGLRLWVRQAVIILGCLALLVGGCGFIWWWMGGG